MSAVAVAAGVGAAASVATGVMGSQAAKKGASQQSKAGAESFAMLQKAITDANNQAAQNNATNQAIYAQTNQANQQLLNPYASVGPGALNSLQAMTRAPIQARGAIAESGYKPEQVQQFQQAYESKQAEIAKLQADADNVANQLRSVKYSPALAPLIQQGQRRHNELTVQIQQAQQQAQQAQQQYETAKSQPYQAAQDAITAEQAAADKGGDIYRQFDAQDYANDPTTGGNAPPDLTKNFDQAAWFAQQGRDQADLTKNFNQDEWFQKQGRSAQDLTKDYDQAAWLQSQGKDVNALTQNFDRTGYLKDAGFTEADLARKFTANDFQTDPGYEFRLAEGNKAQENSAAARGSLLSGATLKALSKYNQDFASNEYQNAYNRFGTDQTKASNALTGAENSYNTNRNSLSAENTNAFNMYNTNRSNLSGELTNAYNRYGTDRANLSNELTGAYNRFGADRQNASNVYQGAFDRFTGQNLNKFNMLSNMAGIGQNAVQNQAGYNTDYSNQAGGANNLYSQTYNQNLNTLGTQGAGIQQDIGNVQAAGTIGSSNAMGQGMAGVSNALMQGSYLYGNQQNRQNGTGGGTNNGMVTNALDKYFKTG